MSKSAFADPNDQYNADRYNDRVNPYDLYNPSRGGAGTPGYYSWDNPQANWRFGQVIALHGQDDLDMWKEAYNPLIEELKVGLDDKYSLTAGNAALGSANEYMNRIRSGQGVGAQMMKQGLYRSQQAAAQQASAGGMNPGAQRAASLNAGSLGMQATGQAATIGAQQEAQAAGLQQGAYGLQAQQQGLGRQLANQRFQTLASARLGDQGGGQNGLAQALGTAGAVAGMLSAVGSPGQDKDIVGADQDPWESMFGNRVQADKYNPYSDPSASYPVDPERDFEGEMNKRVDRDMRQVESQDRINAKRQQYRAKAEETMRRAAAWDRRRKVIQDAQELKAIAARVAEGKGLGYQPQVSQQSYLGTQRPMQAQQRDPMGVGNYIQQPSMPQQQQPGQEGAYDWGKAMGGIGQGLNQLAQIYGSPGSDKDIVSRAQHGGMGHAAKMVRGAAVRGHFGPRAEGGTMAGLAKRIGMAAQERAYTPQSIAHGPRDEEEMVMGSPGQWKDIVGGSQADGDWSYSQGGLMGQRRYPAVGSAFNGISGSVKAAAENASKMASMGPQTKDERIAAYHAADMSRNQSVDMQSPVHDEPDPKAVKEQVMRDIYEDSAISEMEKQNVRAAARLRAGVPPVTPSTKAPPRTYEDLVAELAREDQAMMAGLQQPSPETPGPMQGDMNLSGPSPDTSGQMGGLPAWAQQAPQPQVDPRMAQGLAQPSPQAQMGGMSEQQMDSFMRSAPLMQYEYKPETGMPGGMRVGTDATNVGQTNPEVIKFDQNGQAIGIMPDAGLGMAMGSAARNGREIEAIWNELMRLRAQSGLNYEGM